MRERERVFADEESERASERSDCRGASRREEDRGNVRREMKIEREGERQLSWEKDVHRRERESEREIGREGETGLRERAAVRARVGRRKRVVRRRLVCGAFTGVGPSFILPLQSVNTYLPMRGAFVCAALCTHTRTHTCADHA